MFVPFIYNTRPVPATLSDDKLRRAAILDAQTAKQVEDHFRVQCVDMGYDSNSYVDNNYATLF